MHPTAFMGMMVAIWLKRRKTKCMNYDDILGTDLDIQALEKNKRKPANRPCENKSYKYFTMEHLKRKAFQMFVVSESNLI